MSRLALCLLFAAACAPAETGPTTPSGPAPAAEGDQMVCHEESVTGSNMTRTVCRSQSQIDQDRHDAQQFNARTGRILQKDQGN